MSHFWPEDEPKRNPLLGHRCYDTELEGVLRYDPPRPGRRSEWVACVELPESFAEQARSRFLDRHGIALEPPEFGFHMTVFRGPIDRSGQLARIWGHLEGEKVKVQLTSELFWKERFVWANCHCPEYLMLRQTLAGIDCSDSESWGHATIGNFPSHSALPRFLNYRDLDDWGFRP